MSENARDELLVRDLAAIFTNIGFDDSEVCGLLGADNTDPASPIDGEQAKVLDIVLGLSALFNDENWLDGPHRFLVAKEFSSLTPRQALTGSAELRERYVANVESSAGGPLFTRG